MSTNTSATTPRRWLRLVQAYLHDDHRGRRLLRQRGHLLLDDAHAAHKCLLVQLLCQPVRKRVSAQAESATQPRVNRVRVAYPRQRSDVLSRGPAVGQLTLLALACFDYRERIRPFPTRSLIPSGGGQRDVSTDFINVLVTNVVTTGAVLLRGSDRGGLAARIRRGSGRSCRRAGTLCAGFVGRRPAGA